MKTDGALNLKKCTAWLMEHSLVRGKNGSAWFIPRTGRMLPSRLIWRFGPVLLSRQNGGRFGPMEVHTGFWEDGKFSKMNLELLNASRESISRSPHARLRKKPNVISRRLSSRRKMLLPVRISTEL